jgi:hypothetical protein
MLHGLLAMPRYRRIFGGEPGDWCVGAARDSALDGKLPFQESREISTCLTGVAYGEAHTLCPAADAVDYLVSERIGA